MTPGHTSREIVVERAALDPHAPGGREIEAGPVAEVEIAHREQRGRVWVHRVVSRCKKRVARLGLGVPSPSDVDAHD